MTFVKAIKAGKDYIVEDHGDGTYTLWGYSVWGAIGQTGRPDTDTEIVPLKTKGDFARADKVRATLERAERSQVALYAAMKGGNV